MAHFFPSNILDNVLKQLELAIFQSNRLNFLQRNQFRHLRSQLELIRCVIDEAEPMAVLVPDIVGKWVRDLYNMLHEIDDLLDEVVTRSMPSSGGMLGKVGLRLYRLPCDLTIAPKVKSFNKRLESIVNECYKCNLLAQPVPSSSTIVRGGVERPVARKGITCYDPNGDHCQMIGRDDDKKKIIQMLLDEDHLANLVIWMVGEVGVGKTTLCRAIYNDEEVDNHFDSRQWVNYKDIGDSILDSLIERIGREDNKTLVVLDGMTIGGFDLEDLVAASQKGSKILVNSSGRPRLYSGVTIHKISNLSQEHCWPIFENTVFVQGRDKKEWMIDSGKIIADKCGGIPSLLRVVSTLLHQNDDEALWDYFASDFDFDKQYKHYIQVFGRFQAFPKCQEAAGYLTLFRKYEPTWSILNDQYRALGFTNLSSTMHQRFKRSFFLLEGKKEDRWDEDLIIRINNRDRDIITWMAGSEAIFLESSMDIGHGEEVRHVAIDRPSSSSSQQRGVILPHGLINGAVHKIRSLLFQKELCPVRMSVETLNTLTSKLLKLRVLDLHDLALKALPSSFEKLIHLRYVDLSRNEFKELPKSICRLRNLQTLKLIYCDKLVKLPQCIKSLFHLKHLELSRCLDLTHMPPAIAEMTSLERLDRFIVGPRKGGLRYLKNLNNLRGHLCIELPRQWEKSTEDAEQTSLKSKDGLTSIRLKWSGAYSGDDENGNNVVLDNLEPSTSINCLSIINFGGTTFSKWITSLGMEGCLTDITISHCRGCKILPPFHEMPKLKSLSLTFMDIVEYLQDDNDRGNAASTDTIMFFPSLRELTIGRMPELIGWSRDISRLPRFSEIDKVAIWGCPHLTAMPPFSRIFFSLILQGVSKKLLQGLDWKQIESLEIISVPDVVSQPYEFVHRLPESLTVKDCDGWQVFCANEGEQTPTTSRSLGWEGFQRLRFLTIENCPAMKYMSSSLRRLTNLVDLEIYKCSDELDCLYEEDEDGMPWKNLKSLSSLHIGGFEKLVTLPKSMQHIPGLDTLRIYDCKSLRKFFHFSELNEAEVRLSIQFLSIVNCPAMKYLSSGLSHSVGLRSLKISKCSEELDCLYKEDEDGMPWKALGKLGSLTIEGFEKLVALPKGLQHLRLLYELEIRDCKILEGGLPALPQLESLYMNSCPRFSKERIRDEHAHLEVVEE